MKVAAIGDAHLGRSYLPYTVNGGVNQREFDFEQSFTAAVDLALAQQPDASPTITRTLFVGLAMIESTAIYCFVISMILLFANPFWNHVVAQAAVK